MVELSAVVAFREYNSPANPLLLIPDLAGYQRLPGKELLEVDLVQSVPIVGAWRSWVGDRRVKHLITAPRDQIPRQA